MLPSSYGPARFRSAGALTGAIVLAFLGGAAAASPASAAPATGEIYVVNAVAGIDRRPGRRRRGRPGRGRTEDVVGPLALAPGDHVVSFTVTGRAAVTASVDVEAGKSADVVAHLGVDPAPARSSRCSRTTCRRCAGQGPARGRAHRGRPAGGRTGRRRRAVQQRRERRGAHAGRAGRHVQRRHRPGRQRPARWSSARLRSPVVAEQLNRVYAFGSPDEPSMDAIVRTQALPVVGAGRARLGRDRQRRTGRRARRPRASTRGRDPGRRRRRAGRRARGRRRRRAARRPSPPGRPLTRRSTSGRSSAVRVGAARRAHAGPRRPAPSESVVARRGASPCCGPCGAPADVGRRQRADVTRARANRRSSDPGRRRRPPPPAPRPARPGRSCRPDSRCRPATSRRSTRPASAPTASSQVPDDASRVGWWTGGARAGEPFGSIVVAGHVDSREYGIGILSELLSVRGRRRARRSATARTRAGTGCPRSGRHRRPGSRPRPTRSARTSTTDSS